MDSLIGYFYDTGQKNGLYRVYKCKFCRWLIENLTQHDVPITEKLRIEADKFIEKRVERFTTHTKKCPGAGYKHLVPGITSTPSIASSDIAPSDSILPSDSNSTVTVKRRKTSHITPSR
jgi:hypothetical protein